MSHPHNSALFLKQVWNLISNYFNLYEFDLIFLELLDGLSKKAYQLALTSGSFDNERP
jgi:hypothetical protein